MPSWKMMKEFGKAIGKRTGAPNKTSKMIERAAGDSDEFLEGKRYGEFLKDKATDASYQAMYDRLDDDAKAVFDSYDLDYERAYGPDDAYRKALEDAKLDAYTKVPTDRHDWLETYGFDISEPAPRNVDVSKRVDKLSADESEKALKTEFDDELDKLTKQNVRENPQRGFFTEDEVRKESINMLKSGADISDVFEYLRGNTDHIKVNPTKLKEHTTIRTSPKSSEDADVGVVWDYLADRIDNPEKLDYIMNYHDEFIRQELRNGKSPEDIARTLDTDIFD